MEFTKKKLIYIFGDIKVKTMTSGIFILLAIRSRQKTLENEIKELEKQIKKRKKELGVIKKC
jgi:hypothetical protein